MVNPPGRNFPLLSEIFNVLSLRFCVSCRTNFAFLSAFFLPISLHIMSFFPFTSSSNSLLLFLSFSLSICIFILYIFSHIIHFSSHCLTLSLSHPIAVHLVLSSLSFVPKIFHSHYLYHFLIFNLISLLFFFIFL